MLLASPSLPIEWGDIGLPLPLPLPTPPLLFLSPLPNLFLLLLLLLPPRLLLLFLPTLSPPIPRSLRLRLTGVRLWTVGQSGGVAMSR